MASRAAGLITSFLERCADRGVANKKRRKQKHYSELAKIWDQRLPRAHSSSGDYTAIVHPAAQTEAIFFSKLPLEICHGLEYLLPHVQWHLTSASHNTTSVQSFKSSCICAFPHRDKIRQHICSYAFCGHELEPRVARDNIEDTKPKPFDLMCPAVQQLRGFPVSCKQAYGEAAHLIYDSNTFYFHNLTAFCCFQLLVPPRHFHAIRSLHLRWAHAWDVKYFLDGFPPSNLEAWKNCWRQIAKMEGLESLNVVIALGVPEYEEEFLGPIVDVAKTVRVKVDVAWKGDGTTEWPFHVNRGVDELF